MRHRADQDDICDGDGRLGQVASGERGLVGRGKGQPEGWVAVVLPGRVLFEMAGVTRETLVRISMAAVRNVLGYLSGAALADVVS